MTPTPSPNPTDYRWLSDEDFPLGVAGCITVVRGSDRAKVASAFGSDLGTALAEPDLLGDHGAFQLGADAVIAIEDNGYQGTREAVLARASKASTNGKAASIFWNVNGVVRFTCAAKGKLVASVELGYVDDPEDLPRALRRLAALGEDDEADLVAIGAAMVEKYTGMGFTAADLASPMDWYLLEPPLDTLPTVTEESASLSYWAQYGDEPHTASVWTGIGTLEADRQRLLAQWVAKVAFDQAAIGDQGDRYRQVVDTFDGTAAQVVPADLVLYMQKVERAWSAGHTALAISDNRWFPMRSLYWLGQVHLMGVALRYACHTDPPTAAWEAVYNASRSLDATRLLGGPDARAALYPAVMAFISEPQMSRDAFEAQFPEPVGPAARQGRLEEERAVYDQARGDWDAEEWAAFGEDHGPIEPFSLPR